MAHFLFTMKEQKLFVATGHACTLHFAEAQLDMDHRRTREFMQIGATLLNLELLDEAFCEGEISWSKVKALLPVIQKETQHGWVEYAKRVTCYVLKQEVHGCRPGDLPGEGDDYGLPHQKTDFLAKLPDELLAELEEERVALSESPETLLSNEELLRELLRRSREARGADGARAPRAEGDHEERNDEAVPPQIRERILRRDAHRCCNCNTHLDVEIHHVKLRSRGGTNAAHNLVTLCKLCHASMHRGYLVLHGNPEHRDLWFTDARGTPIHRGTRAPASAVR